MQDLVDSLETALKECITDTTRFSDDPGPLFKRLRLINKIAKDAIDSIPPPVDELAEISQLSRTATVEAPEEPPDDDEGGGIYEFLSFFCPILGILFWAVFANTKPKLAGRIGVATAFGFLLGFIFWVVWMSNRGI